MELAKAYGAMVQVLGGPQSFLQLKLVESGTYEKMALANAGAVRNMSPKITSWTTGTSGSAEAGGDGLSTIRNIMQALPPLFSTIHDQTGIAPPEWVAQMPAKTPNEPDRKIEANLAKAKLPGANGTSNLSAK